MGFVCHSANFVQRSGGFPGRSWIARQFFHGALDLRADFLFVHTVTAFAAPDKVESRE
jgi:hypothetical protein